MSACGTESYSWPVLLILCISLLLIPFWWYISHHNQYTYNVLYTGWTPIIGAMVISRWVCLFLCLLFNDQLVMKY